MSSWPVALITPLILVMYLISCFPPKHLFSTKDIFSNSLLPDIKLMMMINFLWPSVRSLACWGQWPLWPFPCKVKPSVPFPGAPGNWHLTWQGCDLLFGGKYPSVIFAWFMEVRQFFCFLGFFLKLGWSQFFLQKRGERTDIWSLQQRLHQNSVCWLRRFTPTTASYRWLFPFQARWSMCQRYLWIRCTFSRECLWDT